MCVGVLPRLPDLPVDLLDGCGGLDECAQPELSPPAPGEGKIALDRHRAESHFRNTDLQMGNLKKKRRLKMNKHKRRKRLKSNRHKKRTWQK